MTIIGVLWYILVRVLWFFPLEFFTVPIKSLLSTPILLLIQLFAQISTRMTDQDINSVNKRP